MYHEAASGQASVNLDAWAMSQALIHDLAANGNLNDANDKDCDFLIVEGAMGVLDGAGSSGIGSSSDLAKILEVPIIIIVDAAKVGHSVILPVLGLKAARPNLKIAGLIANRVASRSHAARIKSAADQYGIKLLGTLRRNLKLDMPSRHLGLVPAQENLELEAFLNEAACSVERDLDIEAIKEVAEPLRAAISEPCTARTISPIGQRIAVARDEAFCFIYPHLLADWRKAGAELHFFSPLRDERPPKDCDSVFLPGGYPELHAPRIAAATQFRKAMHILANQDAMIYGECGGYMVLGDGLEDHEGKCHSMLNLLSHSTSFKNRKLHLGYRHLRAIEHAPFVGNFAGHEFHYSSLIQSGKDQCLFVVKDADGNRLPNIGGQRKSISGSFAHLICVSSSLSDQ